MSAAPVTFLLRLPCPPVAGEASWGDYDFGMSLAAALRARGHRVLVDFVIRRGKKTKFSWLLRRIWTLFRANFFGRRQVDLILRGRFAFGRRPGRPAIMWLISNSLSVPLPEFQSMSHVFVASNAYADKLLGQGLSQTSVLLQCTDSSHFSPDLADAALATDCLFVGNRRDFERTSVTYALRAGLPLQVWGRHWSAKLPPTVYAGKHIENADLGRHYASAKLVLNDHTPDMLAAGFTSNRVFDVLASGVPLVTDHAQDLPPSLAQAVLVYHDYDSFVLACNAALTETEADKTRRRALAQEVRRDHDFNARAAEIERVALQTLGEKA